MTAEGVTQDRVMRHRVITGLRTLRRHHRARPGDPDGLTRRASRAGHDVVEVVTVVEASERLRLFQRSPSSSRTNTPPVMAGPVPAIPIREARRVNPSSSPARAR